jgi:hypothetical protein
MENACSTRLRSYAKAADKPACSRLWSSTTPSSIRKYHQYLQDDSERVNSAPIPVLHHPHPNLNLRSTEVCSPEHVKERSLRSFGTVERIGVFHVLDIAFDITSLVEIFARDLSHDFHSVFVTTLSDEPPRTCFAQQMIITIYQQELTLRCEKCQESQWYRPDPICSVWKTPTPVSGEVETSSKNADREEFTRSPRKRSVGGKITSKTQRADLCPINTCLVLLGGNTNHSRRRLSEFETCPRARP